MFDWFVVFFRRYTRLTELPSATINPFSTRDLSNAFVWDLPIETILEISDELKQSDSF
jgi:hypothetical protein